MFPVYQPLSLARVLAACGTDADPDIVRQIWDLRKPCMTLVREILGDELPGANESYLFGEPHLPPDVPWPTDADGEDLMFLCQLNLEQIPSGELSAMLPARGMLYFFGSERALMEGDLNESCAVVYAAGTDRLDVRDDEFGLIADFPICRLHPIADYSLPSVSFFDYSEYGETIELGVNQLLNLRNTVSSAWQGMTANQSFPVHQMFGHLSDPQGTEIGDDDHVLLQIDSDKYIGLSWLDAGTVFFLIDADSLRNQDWAQIRMQISSA